MGRRQALSLGEEMAIIWIMVLLVFPNQALLSGLDRCGVYVSSSSNNMSPWMQSLQCHNDYNSHVDCKWKAPTNTTLQVWLKVNSKDSSRKLCVPFEAENATEDEEFHCRYETQLFRFSTEHTVFFTDNQTTSLCSSSQNTSHDLIQMRARPPKNLSVSEESDGSYIVLWSSPYPASSPLNKNLTYELSFKMQTEDTWTKETVSKTSMRLQRDRLQPGHRYEAKVRAKASLGFWSQWSPVVTWKTGEDLGLIPSLHCVLDSEKEVTCSWEVSREVANLITYQLTCRHTQTAQFERCCLNPAVSSNIRGTAVRYSCPLTAVDPKHLQLKLLLSHNAKAFIVHKHIRPNSPREVKVSEKNSDWVVEWSAPHQKGPNLFYQVWYYMTKDQESSVQLNISEGSTCVTILGASLVALQDYEVRVRSLVATGHGSSYEGIPSEWSNPVKWTSNEATWSVSKLIYIFTATFAAAMCLTLYHTIPLCQKKLMLWVDSVPSPGKSKILSEIKSSASPTFMQSEKTSICRVQHLDNVSTCSSDALLCQTNYTEKNCGNLKGQCWNCGDLSSPADNVLDTSSLSFSGPYILCQETGPMSVKLQQKGLHDPSSDEAALHFPAAGAANDKDYVCLPSHTLSRSTEDLTSHSSSGPKWYNSPEEDQRRQNATLLPYQSESLSGFVEPTVENQPAEDIAGPLPSWPQEGANSGYCQLPPPFMATTK